jgi:hypothetical protein
MSGFDNAWYAEMIDRFTADSPPGNLPAAVDGHGRSVVAAACILAQAIDDLAAAVREVARSNEELREGGG